MSVSLFHQQKQYFDRSIKEYHPNFADKELSSTLCNAEQNSSVVAQRELTL